VGYAHYFSQQGRDFDPAIFAQVARECQTLCQRTEIPLADGDGTGQPTYTDTMVRFNGRADCGHAERDLGITWPHPQADGGVATLAPPGGDWFAGALLTARTCGGNCSHDTFLLAQRYTRRPWEREHGESIDSCKTAYKPYDLLVTGCLVILKHHFPDQVRVSSDGDSRDWDDARRLCQHVLGYGADFVLDDEDEDEDEDE
jgi:hypothetical protein